MNWFLFILLFLVSIAACSIPIFFQKYFKENWMTLLLAFSGAFLLAITFIHLIPEVYHELGEKAGIYILIGFGLQLLLQRLSHGVEHGHVHQHQLAPISFHPIFLGLFIHAFMEGIPLGFTYQSEHTMPSLFMAIAAHKIPEAITLSTLLLASNVKINKWIFILLFALASPLSAILAMLLGQNFYFISNQLIYIIPIVAGSFLHIATTILYESGTQHHQLSTQKIIATVAGLACAAASIFI